MKQGPSREHYSPSDGQETPCILWNLTVRYRTQNITPLSPVLYQMKPAHTSFILSSSQAR
jgi:hypothetical protein